LTAGTLLRHLPNVCFGSTTTRSAATTIEARTKIKVDLSGIPRQGGDLNPTMLVIGTKPTDYDVAR
jgi:hypothetical protein